MKRSQLIFAASLLLTSHAYASLPLEWLVRFKDSRIVRANFSSERNARKALAQISKRSDVESIAPNLRYRVAVDLRPRAIDEVDAIDIASDSKDVFLETDWASVDLIKYFRERIPAVLLPGRSNTGPDPLLRQDWAMAAVRIGQATSPVVNLPLTIALIDTGIDYNHEDLISVLWRKPGQSREVGVDFVHRGVAPYDVRAFDWASCMDVPACFRAPWQDNRFLINAGHGTHVAGHIAAAAGNAVGIRGAGAGARLMTLKVFKDAGEDYAGEADDAAIVQAVDYAIRNGARIINLSLGARNPRADGERSELKGALQRARQAGILVVIAAGNDSINQDSDASPSFPAAYDLDNLIVVANVNRRDQLSTTSNYGPRTVHIAAPGVDILSTRLGGGYSNIVATARNRAGRESSLVWEGTSMAAPFVTGAAALVWSRSPQADYKEVKRRILSSVRRVPGLRGRVMTGGVLDVAAALR